MYEQLKTLMPNADIFYGPVTQQQAFAVNVHSYAVPVGSSWYIGVNVELADYADKLIPKPPTPEPEVTTQAENTQTE